MGMDVMFGIGNKTGTMHSKTVELTGAKNSDFAAQTHGLMAGTRIASNLGWRAIEALAVGDSVLTFDNGMQDIVEVRRTTFWTDAPDTPFAQWPVIVPVNALGNREELTLLADQGVVVESDAAADMYGDPFAIIAAHALDGVREIYRAPPAEQIELIAIYFAGEEVIYAEGGALIHCPANLMTLDAFLNADASTYDVLSPRAAAFVAECLVVEDQILASGGMVEGQRAANC